MGLLMEISFAFIGLLSIYLGITQYMFWIDIAPGGGFMPILIGALLIIVSLSVILGKSEKVKVTFSRKEILPVLALLVVIILNMVIGMILSLAIMVLGWLKFVEDFSWKYSITAALIIGTLVYAIFSVWLKVPFPTGLLGF